MVTCVKVLTVSEFKFNVAAALFQIVMYFHSRVNEAKGVVTNIISLP